MPEEKKKEEEKKPEPAPVPFDNSYIENKFKGMPLVEKKKVGK